MFIYFSNIATALYSRSEEIEGEPGIGMYLVYIGLQGLHDSKVLNGVQRK